MAKHEFGIMPSMPKNGERYDSYEPQKYHCIAVDDELIEPLDAKWRHLDCFWHSLDIPGKGLAYCGITLVPPAAADLFAAEVGDCEALRPLKELLLRACREGRYLIHYGL